jgi:hypothetical protein
LSLLTNLSLKFTLGDVCIASPACLFLWLSRIVWVRYIKTPAFCLLLRNSMAIWELLVRGKLFQKLCFHLWLAFLLSAATETSKFICKKNLVLPQQLQNKWKIF